MKTDKPVKVVKAESVYAHLSALDEIVPMADTPETLEAYVNRPWQEHNIDLIVSALEFRAAVAGSAIERYIYSRMAHKVRSRLATDLQVELEEDMEEQE